MGPAGPLITRLDDVTVKVWAKSEAMPEYELLLDVPLHLPSLHFVGKTVRTTLLDWSWSIADLQ